MFSLPSPIKTFKQGQRGGFYNVPPRIVSAGEYLVKLFDFSSSFMRESVNYLVRKNVFSFRNCSLTALNSERPEAESVQFLVQSLAEYL